MEPNEDFKIEAIELLDAAEESLLELDKSAPFKEHYNEIFRAFHSIKGAAGMFAMESLQKHMHYLENLLSSKQQQSNLSAVTIDYFLAGVDGARSILEGETIDFRYFDPDKEERADSPEIKKAQMIREKPREKNEKSARGIVWIVDDEEDILEIIESDLTGAEYTVRAFNSAKELLSELPSGNPDLIVSDIKMPEMSGIELVKEVNKKRPHLPVIILSGFVTKETCLDVLQHGVVGILEKPYDDKKLLSLVNLNVNRYQNIRLLNKSIDLLIYQFENFPKLESEDTHYFDHYKNELKIILTQKNNLYQNLV